MGCAGSNRRAAVDQVKTTSRKYRSRPVSGTVKSSLPNHGGESSDASAHLIGAARRRRRWERRVFSPDLLRGPGEAYRSIDFHVGGSAKYPPGMGTVLVPGPAEPHDAVSSSRRRDLACDTAPPSSTARNPPVEWRLGGPSALGARFSDGGERSTVRARTGTRHCLPRRSSLHCRFRRATI